MPATLSLGIRELLKREMGMVQQFGADSKFELAFTNPGVHYIGGGEQIFGYTYFVRAGVDAAVLSM